MLKTRKAEFKMNQSITNALVLFTFFNGERSNILEQILLSSIMFVVNVLEVIVE